MITAEMKDKVLGHIVNSAPTMVYRGSYEELATDVGVSADVIRGILRDFSNRGLIDHRPNQTLADSIINVKAHDYLLVGGHIGEFENMRDELTKLQAEILALEKTIEHQKFERMMEIIDTAMNYCSRMFPRI